ncbi:unnamed protein product [Ilex paraguariensis]|uniref:Uncharacterized protein n=1 Tax=Ilex paraguariensis TaxID=185542 RepID=A0ABC8RMH2_9AQUA
MGSFEEERLVQMVRDYIESESTTPFSGTPSKPYYQVHQETTSLAFSLQELLQNVTAGETEILEKTIWYLKVLEDNIGVGNNLKEWLVLNLKQDGYEASLCQTSWVSTFVRPSGGYEYIDVLMKDDSSGKPTRLIVDMDFRSQFELARPTTTYSSLLNSLPSIFVGTEEKLNQTISLLCSAAKQSLKEKGLHIPPWRRVNYMQSKWLSENCKKVSSFSPNWDNFCGSPKSSNRGHSILKP